MPELDDLALLKSCAGRAGAIARSFYGRDCKRWTKEGGSPVTEADLAVDNFLKSELLAARPDYGWLSEESKDNAARLNTARVFVVDPIDGTVAFVKQKPHFTICIAVVEQGRPLTGVVYNPISEECFTAAKGGGAFCNDTAIHVSDRTALEGARVLGPKSSFEPNPADKTPWPAMEVSSFSSLAYRVALVAAGQYDAMVSLSAKRDWDLAAADLILHEAGGRITDETGALLCYNGPAATQRAAIAAGPVLHTAILEHLRQKKA